MSNETMDAAVSKEGVFGWYKDINSKQWKAFVAAFLGWTLDAMDLLLFAFAVESLTHPQVFALSRAEVGLLFTVTLVASGAGGVLFGVISDYIGRVRALTYTILIYSIFTGLSGFAPTVTVLLIFRIFLGLGMGGEWASGEVLVAETWPDKHRAKGVGLVQSGWGVGYILAACLATVILGYVFVEGTTWDVPFFGEMDGINLGWRVLFIVGVLPAFLVLYIRRHLDEPEIWKQAISMKKEGKLGEGRSGFTLGQIFSGDLIRYTITSVVLTSFCMLAYWGLYFWMPGFIATPVEQGGVGLGTKGFAWIIPINVGAVLGCNTFGWVADRIGRKPVFAGYLIATAILVFIFGYITELADFFGISRLAAFLIVGPFLGFFGTGFYSGFGALFAEVFPTRARGTAQGFCYNVGRVIGALAPPLAGYVADVTGSFGPAFLMLSLFALVAAATILTYPETRGKKLDI
ncbi:MAG TPA: MFS transporter [Thermodesulfobacteriota bacterium]|nr:MFS transporter [Thermodesulfobacteriota bacterium]